MPGPFDGALPSIQESYSHCIPLSVPNPQAEGILEAVQFTYHLTDPGTAGIPRVTQLAQDTNRREMPTLVHEIT